MRESIELYAGYFSHPRSVEETIALVGLEEKADDRARKLSGGQQRRLDVGMALVGDPELLFLDEPTTGFDPSARRQFWDVIAGLRDLGKTIFLTTHYMDEAQRLADRVTIIAAGQIVAEGTPEDLGERDKATTTIRYRDAAGEEVTIETLDPVRELNRLTGEALKRGEELDGLEVTRPSLEDVYLDLTATAHREGGRRMSGLALVGHQFRFDQKAFWRNPASVGFTVFFPVLLLVIFGSIFGSDTVEIRGTHIDTDTYYVPAIITMSIISSTMQTLAMSLVIAREDGRLKRGRGTPMPPWVFIAGRVGNSIVTAVVMLVAARPDRRPRLQRPLPLGPDPGDPAGAGDRRRLLLLPRHRAHRRDPDPGRRRPDRQLHPAAALLPLRRLHPRRPAAERDHPLRRRLPDPPFLPRLLRRLRARRRPRGRLGTTS